MAFTSVEDTLVALRNCFCSALAESSVPPAVCCISVGRPVVADCCQGVAWVRLVNAFPATNFPSQDRAPSNCISGVWGMTVELGVARCQPQPCDVLDNSCCDGELDVALLLIEDFAIMRKLLTCCLPPDLRPDEIVPGAWKIGEPQGGCVDSTMQLTLRWLDSCAC